MGLFISTGILKYFLATKEGFVCLSCGVGIFAVATVVTTFVVLANRMGYIPFCRFEFELWISKCIRNVYASVKKVKHILLQRIMKHPVTG